MDIEKLIERLTQHDGIRMNKNDREGGCREDA